MSYSSDDSWSTSYGEWDWERRKRIGAQVEQQEKEEEARIRERKKYRAWGHPEDEMTLNEFAESHSVRICHFNYGYMYIYQLKVGGGKEVERYDASPTMTNVDMKFIIVPRDYISKPNKTKEMWCRMDLGSSPVKEDFVTLEYRDGLLWLQTGSLEWMQMRSKAGYTHIVSRIIRGDYHC